MTATLAFPPAAPASAAGAAVVPRPSDGARRAMTAGVVAAALLLVLTTGGAGACGPGRGAGWRRGPRKLTPLVFKQHAPNVPENAITASGPPEGRVGRNDTRFQDLVPNYNQDVVFKDEEGTGADRLMTQRCREKLDTLAISVMNQWPGVKLLVTEGWDEEGYHTPSSLHYEGRAVDVTTSDRDRSKYGMLARLAVEAGFDWVYYESRAHIHCSVKSESSQAAKYGGCFPATSTVLTSTGAVRKLSDLRVGERIQARDPVTNKLIFSEVLLFLDYDPHQRRTFLQIELSSGRTLKVTPSHLVLSGSRFIPRTVFAESLSIGDKLLVRDVNGTDIVEDRVVRIGVLVEQGVFAPLTEAGTVVVDGVVASCYAAVASQSIAQWAFLPVRLAWNLRAGLARVWNVVRNPLKSWEPRVTTTVSAQPETGVYWYARVLYNIAYYLIPAYVHE